MEHEYNISVPLQEYINVPNDVNGKCIKKNRFKTISAYGDNQWPIKIESRKEFNTNKYTND